MNGTQASLLGLLNQAGRALTGGDLVRSAEESIGDFWTLTRSQVHRELAALEAQGLVARGAPGPRSSRPYAVTDAGRAAFRDWLRQDPAAETIRFPLLLWIGFAADLPRARRRRILDTHERAHRERLARYRALAAELDAAGVDAPARAPLAFGLRYEEAVLCWFSELPRSLRD